MEPLVIPSRTRSRPPKKISLPSKPVSRKDSDLLPKDHSTQSLLKSHSDPDSHSLSDSHDQNSDDDERSPAHDDLDVDDDILDSAFAELARSAVPKLIPLGDDDSDNDDVEWNAWKNALEAAGGGVAAGAPFHHTTKPTRKRARDAGPAYSPQKESELARQVSRKKIRKDKDAKSAKPAPVDPAPPTNAQSRPPNPASKPPSSTSLSSKTATTTSTTTASSSTPSTFASLHLPPWLLSQLHLLHITSPTSIQSHAIPEILSGRDLVASARTGQGKTAAFALPVLTRLAEDPYGVFGLVLTPTRELAFQIAEQFRILGAAINLRQTVLVGGMDMMTQSLQLTSRPHVVVATPGRLVDHFNSTHGAKEVFGRLKFLILDEADRLLDPTFAHDLDTILSALPPSRNRQTLLFSATMTPEMEVVAHGGGDQENAEGKSEKERPVVVNCTGRYDTVSRLDQRYILVPTAVRETYMSHLVRTSVPTGSVIVFAGRSRTAERIRVVLRELGVPSVAMHAQMSQRDRTASLAKFKTALVRVLVATDVGSRGLDIPEVHAVINFDVPADATDYVHRVGRTARAGRGGVAVTLVTEHDVNLVVNIESKIGKKLVPYDIVESEVLALLDEVAIAKRVANMEMAENGFGERKEINEKKSGKTKKRKVEDKEATERVKV
ncbi:hypothetical protein HDU93_001528 [Gonapodya sp. JEL0774]|nr:hypothetical protein HDU93_001528 [Gonapodya sp. JEL0774]